MLEEWAYAAPYLCDTARREAFPAWLHTYNHHRGHTALGGHPPASRVTNLCGDYMPTVLDAMGALPGAAERDLGAVRALGCDAAPRAEWSTLPPSSGGTRRPIRAA